MGGGGGRGGGGGCGEGRQGQGVAGGGGGCISQQKPLTLAFVRKTRKIYMILRGQAIYIYIETRQILASFTREAERRFVSCRKRGKVGALLSR